MRAYTDQEYRTSLWKYRVVKLDEDDYLIFIYLYATNLKDRTLSYNKCYVFRGSMNSIERNIYDYLRLNPAEKLTTDLFHIDNEQEKQIIYRNKFLSRSYFQKLLNNRFSENDYLSLEDFITDQCENNNINANFPKEYDVNGIILTVENLNTLPKDKWFQSIFKRKPRKTYGRIIF